MIQKEIQKEIAEILNGIEKNEEDRNKQDMRYAKENNCVIVFGASDDLMEFRGGIDNEIDAYEGCTIWVNELGVLKTKHYLINRQGSVYLAEIYISEEDANAEGGYKPDQYERVFRELNPKWDTWSRWVFEFHVIEVER